MKKELIVIVIFLLIAAAMTYPLALNMTTYIPGFFSTDESYAVLWNSWRIKFSLLHNISIRKTDFIAYPYGVDLYTNRPVSYLWFASEFLISQPGNPAIAYNLRALSNFILTAFFTYLLVYFITKSRRAALFSGIAFGFCPYIFVRSWQHLGETYLWPMPLTFWAAAQLREKSRLSGRVIFVSGIILSTFNFQVTYYLAVALFVFLIYTIASGRTREIRFLKEILILSVIAGIILIPQFFNIARNILARGGSAASAHNIYHRPFEDLFAQSAKPLSYFLPAAFHPLFGKFTEQMVGSSLYGASFIEHTLYLGWTPLILALLAWRKRRALYSVPRTLYDNKRFYINFFGILIISAWLFSQPPWWKFWAVKIYMPSFFMYRILPMIRAYCRFGSLVMFAVSVLAGFGLKYILDKYPSPKKQIAITAAAVFFLLFEFWNYPPFKVIDVSRAPQVYYWLKEQPGDFAIAEYPLDLVGPSELYKLYQITHEKKIINAASPGTEAYSFLQGIKKLSAQGTVDKLKQIGVKYAVVHRQAYLDSELSEDRQELDNINRNPGIKLIKSFPEEGCLDKRVMCVKKSGNVDLYEIINLLKE